MAGGAARAVMGRSTGGNSNSNKVTLRQKLSGMVNQSAGGSQPQANDHTHEENNSVPSGGMTGVGGGIQPGLQGLATAVTGSPGAFGSHQPAGMAEVGGVAASSQPQLRGGAGMAANKAAIMQAGASNVMSQNQNGQDMFGGQSIPEKGAIGVAGVDQMEQF